MTIKLDDDTFEAALRRHCHHGARVHTMVGPQRVSASIERDGVQEAFVVVDAEFQSAAFYADGACYGFRFRSDESIDAIVDNLADEARHGVRTTYEQIIARRRPL